MILPLLIERVIGHTGGMDSTLITVLVVLAIIALIIVIVRGRL